VVLHAHGGGFHHTSTFSS